ncbi:MAG: tRNA (cytidine(34)-2'-O)-methyltransferase [Erysipelotrichaceae bacterium]|nr:tRNA (cytidine(34)-2'-O)-methyltransferase [Erysipelotrichaceae bacterium]
MNHVVLFEPEIPQNTGNIMRTCAAFRMQLHIVGIPGFYLDEKHLRRAGMDYREMIEIRRYQGFAEFFASQKGRYVFFSRYGMQSFGDCDLHTDEDVYLIFGKESTGIPKSVLREHLEDTYRLPMDAEARSLNLSNCVAIGAFELLRQQGFPGLSTTEVIKGKDWLLQ